MPPVISHWYVLRTKPYRELRVAAQLSRRGIESYCPQLKAFRKNLRPGQRQIEPLFPCYLFARADLCASYEDIRRLSGLRDVVRFGDHFPCLEDQVIGELRGRETPDGYIRVRPAVRLLEAAEPVVITDGLFAGRHGLFTRYLNGPERVSILLGFLHHQVHVTAPAAEVRPLARRAS